MLYIASSTTDDVMPFVRNKSMSFFLSPLCWYVSSNFRMGANVNRKTKSVNNPETFKNYQKPMNGRTRELMKFLHCKFTPQRWFCIFPFGGKAFLQ